MRDEETGVEDLPLRCALEPGVEMRPGDRALSGLREDPLRSVSGVTCAADVTPSTSFADFRMEERSGDGRDGVALSTPEIFLLFSSFYPLYEVILVLSFQVAATSFLP